MNCPRLHPAAVLLLLVVTSAVSLSATSLSAAPSSDAFAQFEVISDRNIFDLSRHSGSQTASSEVKPEKTETLSLVGTMSYEKGLYAFFESTNPDFRQVLTPGKSMAGIRIAGITGSSVRLDIGGHSVELRVGMQLRRTDDSDWQIVDAGSIQTEPRPLVRESAIADSEAGNDIIKRLMYQREQELK